VISSFVRTDFDNGLVSNGEEYDFLKTISFERAQKTMENPTNCTPI